MKIEEGMYVRTKSNDYVNNVYIRKVDEIDEDDLDKNGKPKFWIDEYICDTYGDEQNKLSEEDVEIASKHIADVIKIGDYVNGKQVKQIIHYRDENFFRIELFGGQALFRKAHINSIVTKEEFDTISYTP